MIPILDWAHYVPSLTAEGRMRIIFLVIEQNPIAAIL